MTTDQEKIALLNQIVNFDTLKESPILMNYLQKALPVIPDSEIQYAGKVIKEIQDNCSHDVADPGFEEVCTKCGFVTKKDEE